MKKLNRFIAKCATIVLLATLVMPSFMQMAFAVPVGPPTLVYNSSSVDSPSVAISGQLQLGFLETLYSDGSAYEPHDGDGDPDTGDVYLCAGAIDNFTALEGCIGGEGDMAITVSLGNYDAGTDNQINIDYTSLAYNSNYTIAIQGLYINGTTTNSSDHYHQFITNAECGNGIIEGPSATDDEQCDDSNTTPGDGCSATCTTEGAHLVVATSTPPEGQVMEADANITILVPHIPDPPASLDPDSVIPGNVVLCQGNVGELSGCTEEETASLIYDDNADGTYNGIIIDPTLTLADGEYTVFLNNVCWDDVADYNPAGNGETPYITTIPDYCIDSTEWMLHFAVGDPSCGDLTGEGEGVCNAQEGCIWDVDECIDELGPCVPNEDCTAPCGGPGFSDDGGTTCFSDDTCETICELPEEGQPAMVFITSTFSGGNLGGITGANSMCQARATAAELDGTWKAIISDGTQNANTILPADIPFIRLDGQLVAENKADLLDGTIGSPISITEFGDPMYDYQDHPLLAWSATTSTGIYYDDGIHNVSCLNWSFAGNDPDNRGIAGIADMTSSEWIEGCAASDDCFPDGALYCDMMSSLYCFSSDTTAMPGEPGGPGGYCGDGVADGEDPLLGGFGEACDTDALRSYTCSTIPDAPFTGGTLTCNSTCGFDVSLCEGGGPPGGDGTGELTVNLVANLGGDSMPTSDTGATVVVACGDLEITDPMNPPENAFFMDGQIAPGESSVTITGIPTPPDPNFTDPCIVFLSPDTAGIALGGSYEYSYTGGDLPSVGPNDFAVSAGTLPMPPGAHYASVQFGADPNATIALNLETGALAEGSLGGEVCIDDHTDGDADTCGAGDTKVGDIDLSVFTMGPPTAGGDTHLNTMSAGNGSYDFGTMPGGSYMIEAFGMAPSGQEFMYMQSVTVNGATDYDVVLSLGNSLDLTLVDPEVGQCWTGEPIFYDFFPMEWSFESMPVMGESPTLTPTIQGFGGSVPSPMTYNAHIEVPGCKAVNGEITFDGDEVMGPIMLTSGITATGRVVTDINDPDNTTVANFAFDAFKEIDPTSPEFGEFVGADTDGNGDFTIYGLSDGDWVFQTFDMFGGQYSFVPGLGDMNPDGTVTILDFDEDNINDVSLTLVVKQDKRVNITVTDGITPITNAMIDISCDSGKYVHLGHSNGAWTNLPGGDSCEFGIFSWSGTYMPLLETVAITSDPNPQDVLLVLEAFNQNTGNFNGFIETDMVTAHKGGKSGYMAHIETNDLSPLTGHTLEIDFPTAIPDGNIAANSVIGTPCTISGGTVTCAMGADSFFDVFVEIEIPVDYPDTTLTAELFVNSVRTKLDTVVSSVVGLSINAPAYVDSGDPFTVYGQGYPDTTLKLVAKAESTGAETILGTTVLAPGSSWYSFADVSLSPGGEETYTLKVTATADGIADSISRQIIVGGSVPTITGVTLTGPYGAMPTNPATGYPAGQLFEGDQFQVDITFSGVLTSVDYNFPVTSLPATASAAFIPAGGNSWTMTMPAGWEGFGNVNLTVNAVHGIDPVDYGSVSEVLVLIDPSGYIYDTVDANRIVDADATVFQLVAGASHASLAQGTTITSITGPDTNTDGSISTAEEGSASGFAVGQIDGCGDGTTLDTTLCTWSTWDASPSGQVNPQLTDVDGKYGWNVPQGWYRVSFAKANEYSLNYSRDVYVPPAETTLNLDIGAYDIAAPTIVSINPANGSTSVPTNVNPVITFSEKMQTSTINTTNIKLKQGAVDIAITTAYVNDNNTVTIAPIGGNLTGATSYTIEVGTGVKDDSSNALASASSTSFTTATTGDSTAPVSSADIATGTYTTAQTVTLSATDDGGAIDPCTNCTIYYTLDGSAPMTSSAVYSVSLVISSTTTLKFFAKDVAGNQEVANSETYTITVSVPSVPTGFTGGPLTNGSSLNWSDTATATSYKVYRSTTSGSGYAEIATPATSLYADYAVTAGTTYYYKVTALNAAGESGMSAEISVTPTAATVITPVTPTGGGGGGGTTSISIPSDSNTVTSNLSTELTEIVSKERTISRPIEIDQKMITKADGQKTATLTSAEGIITLKPNKDSTVLALIPAGTEVVGTEEWDGKINPPLLKAKTIISSNGETIEGSSQKLMRSQIQAIIKVGSSKSTLNFSQTVKLEVSVDLPNGTKLLVYVSEDGNSWSLFNEGVLYTVISGKVIIQTDHLTYFALADPEVGMPIASAFTDIANHWAENYINQIADMGIVSGKSEGKYAPNDQITRAELTKVAVNAFGFAVPEAEENPFLDVDKNAWYAPYIKAAKDNGIVEGMGDGNFAPNAPITRAAALKITIEAAGFEGVYENYQENYASQSEWFYVFFPDVKVGEWYAKYVAYAKDFGIVSGYGDGSFRPASNVTRAEVAKIVLKVLELQ